MALINSVPSSSGYCYLYVLPCAYEDLLKLGFSRDPLARLQALHPRWFEAFDLDRAFLVETGPRLDHHNPIHGNGGPRPTLRSWTYKAQPSP